MTNKFLSEELREWLDVSRREFMQRISLGAASAAVAGSVLAKSVSADELRDHVQVADTGKKVKVGIGLNYGPFNQPWRRGCWRLCKTVLDGGGEIVAVRGEPSKDSEQQSERQLLDRGIDVLCLGIYSQESETAFIVDEAKKRGIKTVGFAVPVKESPAVVEDTWGTAMVMGYQIQNVLQRQGTLVQTAEDRGFYTPFDMEGDLLELMTKYEPRMKMLPFMPGSTSTNDQISKGRENALALLQANPDPDSIQAIVSWWWPLTLGAVQALKQMNRKNIKVFNHYFSDQFLTEFQNPDNTIEFSTDTPWHIMGDKTGELALALGRGEDVKPNVYHVPVTSITKDQAAKSLAEIQEMDKQAIALLKQYGG
ncbi:hypothetical protein FRZ44_30550 [Hypericibacter terrae]|uniref:Periplasmic binding protein domain-containing protein n=1 Tax=Hypericibacter terrae TaxID=2602015 RepID=A0A5J6MJL2_9PROT|nr:sugar ABC transporter substrate-binding protein [Hypericibacter terrae]QEX17752.1 hypothetical protein FRZ44_30550 [Hypericibacter terrae]